MKLAFQYKIFQACISLLCIITGCNSNQSIITKTISNFDNEGQNLVFNGEMEILENGLPVGWNCSGTPSVINHNTCKVDAPGFQSDHALTMPIAENNSLSGSDTQLKFIKPNTKYALSFWYRLPREGKLEIDVFGQRLFVTKMFRYNPMHWCRYSAIVDSGEYSDGCQISFVAHNGKGPHKFWVDRIELYEGMSPIGKNNARLEYQYYNTAYVSPDILSPLPFAFEWTFDDDQRPSEIQYIVELPAEVELIDCALGRICKWPPTAWGKTWLRPDYSSKVKTEKITIDHKQYIRIVVHVQCVPGDEKQFTDYVVPVGIRDYWENSLGRYSGMLSMCLYVRSKVQNGSFPFYYYAKWDKGKQPRRKLNLEITPIKKVPSSQNLILLSEVQLQAGEKNPQLENDFQHIGLNGVGVGYLDLRGGDTVLKSKIDTTRRSGLKYFSLWINIPTFGVDDKDAMSMDINGQRTGTGGWCLSYRGPEWAKKMSEYKKKLEMGVNFFAFDDAYPCNCFCDKCKSLFAEFLKMNTELSYVDPVLFMKNDWSGNEKYKILWQDFHLWHYGKTAQDMKDELVQYAMLKGSSKDIHFGISSWLPFTNYFAAKSLTAFDYDIRQTYMNWWSCGFGGSPKIVGDYLCRCQEALGIYARPLVPTLSPGLSFMHPACALDPYAQMKYQILEAMMATNFSGYLMYAGKDIDVGDMKYMAEANALIIRFEEIVTKGTSLKPIEINEWSVVRIKKLGTHGLVLVSDYSTYEPAEKFVQFSSDELSGMMLVDAETGEEINPVSGIYRVRINETRARLFYLR